MIFVVKAALDSGTYTTTSERRLIGDEMCTEMYSKNGNDRLWLSQEKELCLMRREWLDPTTKKLLGQIVTRRVAEVAPGLWMPVEVECNIFSTTTRFETNPSPRLSTITQVSSFKCGDDVPKELFQLKLKPGSIENIEPGEFRQISSGGTEHLDEVGSFYRGPIGLPQQPPFVERLIYNIALFAVGMLAGIVLFRLRPRSHAGWSDSGKQ
jgi:hypothetical protein